MRVTSLTRLVALAALACVTSLAGTSSAATLVLDDFNAGEGHFNQHPTFSGSTTGLNTNSTADHHTLDSFEGAGSEILVFNDDATAGGTSRVRFLSGTGTPANNTQIPVTAGTDGWIGLALKTDTPGWTVQIWIEGPENGGSIPKTIANDGQWHLYQWNLDDTSGGPDGWGAVAGIAGGDGNLGPGNYTIDSVLFRHTNMPATSTILMDYVVVENPGPIVPEPASAALAGLAGLGLLVLRRRR